MKSWKFGLIALVSGAMVMPVHGAGQQENGKLAGTWMGTLKVMGGQLRLVVRISHNEDGSYSSLLDSPDQGAKDIPTSQTTWVNDSLRIEAAMLGALYAGRYHPDSLVITGTWSQGGMSFPLNLKRSDGGHVMRRPQEPQPPWPYLVEEVTIRNEAAGIELAGTLTRPAGHGPFPAALLISGSGAQDRDETIFGHRPFLVLADHLTRRGLVVLRLDDRGVGKSRGSLAEATTADFVGDALAAAGYLKSLSCVHPRQIGLIGHSEGATVAPMAAVRSRDVAWIVMMAGMGMTGERIIARQSELIARADGADAAAISRNRLLQEQIVAVLKAEKDDSLAAVRLRPIFSASLAELSAEERKALGEGDQYINAQVRQLTSPWFRYFLACDPIPVLRRVKCPVLAINGELDLQVPAHENLQAIERALQAGGNERCRIHLYPGLNHLFQTAQSGSPREYGQIEETMAPQVLQDIGDWILGTAVKYH